MADKNLVELEGSVHGGVFYGTTATNIPYASVSVSVEPPARNEGARSRQTIRVLVFDETLVGVLRDGDAREGRRIRVTAYLVTRVAERRGVTFVQNDVVAYKIELPNK